MRWKKSKKKNAYERKYKKTGDKRWGNMTWKLQARDSGCDEKEMKQEWKEKERTKNTRKRRIMNGERKDRITPQKWKQVTKENTEREKKRNVRKKNTEQRMEKMSEKGKEKGRVEGESNTINKWEDTEREN